MISSLPNGPIEVVFSLDTTGSMSSVLDEVRLRLQDMITRLQADIPGIKFAVVAHGDYCDAEHFYVTKHVDFTDDLPTLHHFMNDVGGTGGGDVSECYELVLRLVREKLSWSPMSQQILIMVGDAYPHEPDYPLNVDGIDWREEIQYYSDAGVHIYGVHVFEDEQSANFLKTISEKTGGEYIKMADFNHVCDVIMAICYRERGADFLEGYEAEVRSRFNNKPMDDGLEGVFGALKRADSKASNTTLPPPISPLSSMTSIDAPITSPVVKRVSLKTKPKRVSKKVKIVKPKITSSKRSSGEGTSSPTRTVTKVSKKTKPNVRRKARNVPATPRNRLPRLRRERVTVNNFLYSDLQWSNWKLAIQPRKVCKRPSRDWVANNNQLQRQTLFPGKRRAQPSLYEVAVQTKPRGKRHVVYFNLVNMSYRPDMWYDILFNDTHVQKQVKTVLRLGCLVYVRRTHLVVRKPNSYNKFSKNIERKYDYAWRESREFFLRKNGLYISQNL